MPHDYINAEYVRQVFDYEPLTGVLSYRKNNRRRRAGEPAGTVGKNKRRLLCFSGKRHLASRVIWLWMTGAWPPDEIDHKNLDSLDNRWENLRAATRHQNARNMRSKNKHGFKGVRQQSFKAGRKTFRYYAMLKVFGKNHYLGRFDTPIEAAKAYDAAATLIFGEFACINFPEETKCFVL